MNSFSSKYREYIRPIIAEFFGKLIFAFLHSSTANTISAYKDAPTGMVGNLLLPAISDGLTVTMIILTFGGISGAHINIAVTIAFALGGEMKYKMVPFYFLAEILGSLAGAALAAVTNGGEASGAFALASGVSVSQGMLMEVILTAILTFVVLMVAVELKSVHGAFAVGFTVVAAILAGGNITGACMNPSLGFGAAVAAGKWENHWIFWVGPILGALISALVFRMILGDKSRLLCHPPPISQSSSTPSNSIEHIELKKNLPKTSNYDADL